jgi:hypothetical protein
MVKPPRSAPLAREAGRDRARGPFGQSRGQAWLATEELNRRWYEPNTGQVITDVQSRIFHPALRWMAANIDARLPLYASA